MNSSINIKYIACCSVLPKRSQSQQFIASVFSIVKQKGVQLEKINIHYPKYCKRLKVPYPPPPSILVEHPKISFIECKDEGPATKFLPALDTYALNNNNNDKTTTRIALVLFDDDQIYPENWLKPMIDTFELYQGQRVIGRKGSLCKTQPFVFAKFNKSEKLRDVSILQTSNVAIYPRSCFPENSKKALEKMKKYQPEGFLNDDFMLSLFAHQTGTKLSVIPTREEEIKDSNLEIGTDSEALMIITGHPIRQMKLFKKMLQNGDIDVPIYETVAFVLIILLLLFLFFFLIIKFYKKKKIQTNKNTK